MTGVFEPFPYWQAWLFAIQGGDVTCRLKSHSHLPSIATAVISRLESLFSPPRLSHDEAFCEQLREDFCCTTGMLGQGASEILSFRVGFKK